MKKYISKRITISLTEELDNYLEQLANKSAMSKSDIVRTILLKDMNINKNIPV